MTPEDRRRRREGRDRHALKQLAVALVIIFGGLGALVATEIAFVEPHMTMATVTDIIDRPTLRGHDCVTQLWTGFGEAHLHARAFCQDLPWHIGDKAEVEARMMRLTQTIVIKTHGTIFERAYSYLPSS